MSEPLTPAVWGNRWADQFSYHPGPDQSFELAHSSIYSTYETLEGAKRQVL